MPAVTVGVDQREDDIATVSIIEMQHRMTVIRIHEVESERNSEVGRRSSIESDVEVGITHQFGTHRTILALIDIQSRELVIGGKRSHQALRQLVAHIVDEDAQISSLAWIEETIGIVVVQHDTGAILQQVVVDRHIEIK